MIIFDLDGTLADCSHRRHFVAPSYHKDWYFHSGFNEFRHSPSEDPITGQYKEGVDRIVKFNPDWTSFYEACDRDLPIKPVIHFAIQEIYLEDGEIWSGRCESVRGKTIEWLKQNIADADGLYRPFDWNSRLKMRPMGDNTADDVLKEKWLDEALAQGKKIEYVFDYRPKVVRMWRRRGIFVFNCNQTDEEF